MIDMLFVVLVFLLFAALCGAIGWLVMALQEKDSTSEKWAAAGLGVAAGLAISLLLYTFATVIFMVPFVIFLCGTIGMLAAAQKDLNTARTVVAVIAGSALGLVIVFGVFQLGAWIWELSV